MNKESELTTISFLWRCDPTRVMASAFLRFLDHTQRRTTVGRTRLDKWSARRRDLYLTTHNTHNRQTSMPPLGFESTSSAGERLQTYALDRAATETSSTGDWTNQIFINSVLEKIITSRFSAVTYLGTVLTLCPIWRYYWNKILKNVMTCFGIITPWYLGNHFGRFV